MLPRDHHDPHPRRDWERLPALNKAMFAARAGGLGGVPMLVYLAMVARADAVGAGMRASMSTLADDVGLNRSTVIRAIKVLERDLWVRCEHRSRGGLTPADRANPTSTWSVLLPRCEPDGGLSRAKRRAHWPRWRPDFARKVGVAERYTRHGVS